MNPVTKAIIPVAGLGTRFLPITKAIPKEMLPLVDRPLIQYVIEEAASAGVEAVVLITSRGKASIENYFDISRELEWFLEEKGKGETVKEVRKISDLVDVFYVRQKEPLGLGHAILCAKKFVEKEPFAVLLGDDVIDSSVPLLSQMMEVYGEYKAPVIAIEKVARESLSSYGIVKIAEGESLDMRWGRVHRLVDMVEKPSPEEAPSDLATVGRYIFTPDIFEFLDKSQPGALGEIQITDSMRELARRKPFYGLEFSGTRYDAGDKLGFIIANIAFALNREELRKKLLFFLRKVVEENG